MNNQPSSQESRGLTELVGALEGEISNEQARKDSIEQRAITVITTSATLATLVFTVVAVITKIKAAENFFKDEQIPIQVGVIAFLVAAVVGLIVNIPLRYLSMDAKSFPPLRDYVRNRDDASELIASDIFDVRVSELKRAQKWNHVKAEFLLAAFFSEVVAVGAITVALFTVLSHIA